jgi:GNAT superfamily N-acetyltransferase
MSRFAGSDQRLYLKVSGNRVEGVLKVGEKQLFHREFSGKVREIKALCVLDFYVHESCQRMGVGKMLFEKMLECENIEPHRLAYDRPSAKLLSFLRKHYNLAEFVPQNNNFVIFNQYFQGSPAQGGQGKGRGTFNEQALHRRTEGPKKEIEATGLPIGQQQYMPRSTVNTKMERGGHTGHHPHPSSPRANNQYAQQDSIDNQADRISKMYYEQRMKQLQGADPRTSTHPEFSQYTQNAQILDRFQSKPKDVFPKGRNQPYNPLKEQQIRELE